MAREFFCAYHSYLNAMRKLSDAECGRLFRALLSYSAGEQLINLQGREEILFDVFADQIDRDNAKYEAKCRKNRENRRQMPFMISIYLLPDYVISKPEKQKQGGCAIDL